LGASQGIRTFTELADEGMLNEIRGQMYHVENMVFLGFAFHPQNLEILEPYNQPSIERIFASAYNISEGDVKAIKDVIQNLITLASSPDEEREIRRSKTQNFQKYFHSGTCSNLFDEFNRSIK
jgi:hypothetical protein